MTLDVARPIDLNDVRILKEVVEHGSFAAASSATGMAKSTISQRIAALERASGTGLLRRSSRSLSLTEAGELLLPHARTLDGVAHQVRTLLLQWHTGPHGLLRIACPTALCQAALPMLLQRFLAIHEDASLRVRLLEAARFADAMAPDVDLVIRDHIRPLVDSSLIQRVVARTSWASAAAPDWLQANAAPTSPDEVPKWAVLASAAVADRAFTFSRDGEERSFVRPSRLHVDDPATLRAMAIAGAGVVCLPDYLLRKEMRAGVLVPVLTDWRSPQSTITIVTPPKAQSSSLASAFSDFLACELPRALSD